MGVVKNVGAEQYPKQGRLLHKDVEVCFNYNTDLKFKALCVRDDAEEHGVTIFRLPDGRHILSTECQYRPMVQS